MQPRFKSWGVQFRRRLNQGREAPEIRERSPKSRAKPEKKRVRGQGRGLSEPLPRNFWNFELQIFKSVYGGKGNFVQKWASIKIGGS